MHASGSWRRRRPKQVLALIRENFDAEMAARGLTDDDEIAKALSVDRSLVGRVRNGKVDPGVGFAGAVKRLGVSLDAVFTYRELTPAELGPRSKAA